MNKKKTVIAAAVLALVVLVGGILAYFTDTEEKTNVFTIGNVDITLTEDGWTEGSFNEGTWTAGTTGEYSRTEAQNLTPNAVIPKAPIVTNVGSNDAYVFVKVTVPMATIKVGSETEATSHELFSYTVNDGWKQLSKTVADNKAVYVYAYATGTHDGAGIQKSELTILNKAGSATGVATPAVFNTVTLADLAEAPASAALTQKIDIKAYAIQSNNIDSSKTTAESIYALFAAQNIQ